VAEPSRIGFWRKHPLHIQNATAPAPISRLRPDGQVRLDSRKAGDLTLSFPDVATALAEALTGRRLSLDGELVATSPTTGANPVQMAATASHHRPQASRINPRVGRFRGSI
jgi:hypothetical protein